MVSWRWESILGLSIEHDETLRPAVDEVATELRDLHRTLMDSALGTYERDVAPVGGPGQKLQLLMYDPAFRWMRTLSGLMACLLYTSPSPRDGLLSRMPSSA